MALCCIICKLPRNLKNRTLCRQVHRSNHTLQVIIRESFWTSLYLTKKSLLVFSDIYCLLVSFQRNGGFVWENVFVFAAGKAMWERLTAPEDGFSKLQRENLAIIESYGKALMEVVCRDACDGHEISRVRVKPTWSFLCLFQPLGDFFFLCPQSWSILTCFSGMPSIFCFYQHLSVLMLTKPNKYSAPPPC